MQGFLITQQSCILSATLLFLGVLKKLTHSIIPFESKAMLRRRSNVKLEFQTHFWDTKKMEIMALNFSNPFLEKHPFAS
jgi:hypothetical protein